MLAKLCTYSLLGIDAKPVEVEVDISPGAMPKTILVGLADTAVKDEHPPDRTGARQQRLLAADRPNRDQSVAGGSPEKTLRHSICRSRWGC